VHKKFPCESVSERNVKIGLHFVEAMTKNQMYQFFPEDSILMSW